MQRLFSLFPTGMAGAALFILRISVALSLLVDGTAHWVLVTSFWILLAFLLVAFLLLLGFLTPYASAIACLGQLGVMLLSGRHDFHLLLSLLNSGVVVLVGPGAYSIDAHLFGRRLLVLSPRR